MAKSEIAKAETQAISKRESFIAEGDVTGTEGITADELRLPRLSIAQGLSDQIIKGSSKYIKGLELTEMFNDLSGENYHNGPIEFVVAKRDVKRIEFIPRSEGGGVRDLDVPPNDPRCQWTVEDGKKVPPKATKFTEFVILMLKEDAAPEPIMLSIKDTNKWNRQAAGDLSSWIKFARKPIYAGLYRISSKAEKNSKGTFGIPVVEKVTLLDNPDVDDATWEKNRIIYEYAKAFSKELEGKKIVVEREDEPHDAEFTEEPRAERPEM
jgi:hypothetical protein